MPGVPLIQWIGRHDPGLRALRRAGRAALVMPAMFALGDVVIGNPTIATFAAFGSFALLLLVDFPGRTWSRLRAQVALAATCSVLICLGTLASQSPVAAVAGMAVIGFAVIFSGVVSSVVAGATTPLLLSFILPVALPAPAAQIPDRLAGWDMAAVASLFAIAVLWPAPARDPVRAAAIAACRALAARLRSEVAFVLAGRPPAAAADHEAAIARAEDAVSEVQAVFFATPYRPTGLSTAARTLVRLVDELRWLDAVVHRGAPRPMPAPVSTRACTVKLAVAGVLERAADLLTDPRDVCGRAPRRPGGARRRPGRARAGRHRPPLRRRRGLGGRRRVGARPELPRPGAELRRRPDRPQRRSRRGRGAAQLARPAHGAAPGRARRAAGVGAGARRLAPRAALGLAAEQPARGGQPRTRRARHQPDGRPARVLGRLRDARGAAHKRARDRAERRSRPARHRSGVRRRRRGRRRDRDGHDAALGASAPCSPLRRPRPGGDLVRGGAGGVHAGASDPLQHHRARGVADRDRPDRGRRPGERRQPRRRPALLAAWGGGGAGRGAGRGLRLECSVSRRRRAASGSAGAIPAPRRRRRRPSSRHGPLRPHAGSTTPSAATWPSVDPSRCRWPR